MSIRHIDTILNKSQTLYNQRQLEEAALHAQQALEQSSVLDNSSKKAADAHFLLGCIYSTKAWYEGNSLYFPKALTAFRTAKSTTNGNTSVAQEVRILLSTGKVYQHSKKQAEATKTYQTALTFSETHQFVEGIIAAKTALCSQAIDNNDYETALKYGKESLKLAETIDLEGKLLLAETYNMLGRIYIRRQDYAETLKIGETALNISRAHKDVENEIIALNNLGIAHAIKSDFKKAMDYLLDAFARSSAINYREQTARCEINIGSIYAHLFNYKAALERLQKAVETYGDIIDSSTKVVLYNNIGNIYYNDGNPEKAEYYFNQALELAQEVHYKELVAMSLAQLGRAYQAQKQYEKALAKTDEAHVLMKQLGDLNGLQIVFINYGEIYFHLENHQKAIRYLSKGVVESKRLKDDMNQIRAYHLLSKIYHKQKDFEQAYKYQSVYTAYREEYSKIQRNRQMLDLEIEYGIQERQKEIERLRSDNRYQALLLEQSDKISEQNEQLREANEELKQFAYAVSHDLKEPLRMIGSYSQIIHRKYKDKFDENSTEYFGYIHEGVTRMNKLLDGLLKYATVGKHEMEMDEVNLDDVLAICQLHLRMLINETNAVVKHDPLPKVVSVQSLLIPLLQNLIGNAIKFHKEDSAPIIELKSTSTDTEHIISVADNGIGIAKEHQSRIFVMFQRLHARTVYEGTGIGLAICQKIMKRLGGNIWVESEEGKGATFYFSLPKT